MHTGTEYTQFFVTYKTWDVFRNCQAGSLDTSKVKGRIVLCFSEIRGSPTFSVIMNQGARGLILVNDDMRIQDDILLEGFLTFPFSIISSKDGNAILSYIRSNR